jgi:hypothetical protein
VPIVSSNFPLKFRLELDIEPIFASMALYDGRVKKKVGQKSVLVVIVKKWIYNIRAV